MRCWPPASAASWGLPSQPGNPSLAGEAIAPPVRLSLVANLDEIFHRLDGRGVAVAMVRKRRGADLDPAVVDTFLDAPD